MLSKACEHGIRALIYIGTQSIKGRRVKIAEIAEHANSPEAYTAKVMGTLSKHKLVESMKGPFGGFFLDVEKMQSMKLISVVKVLDGSDLFEGCVLGLDKCDSKNPCPLHNQFASIRGDLKTLLSDTSLFEMAENLEAGKSVLCR